MPSLLFATALLASLAAAVPAPDQRHPGPPSSPPAHQGPPSWGPPGWGPPGGYSASSAVASSSSATSASASASATSTGATSGAPTVSVKNGTIAGSHSSTYNQDFFLGVPFAQPPIDELRFRIPQSINTTFDGTLEATKYAPSCVGYGGDDIGYPVSEDCLCMYKHNKYVESTELMLVQT